MDRNLFLAFALSFAVLLLWTMLVDPPQRREPPPESAPEETIAATEPSPEGTLPGLEPAEPTPLSPLESVTEPAPSTPRADARQVVVESELYRAEFTTEGAGIGRWELKKFHDGPSNGSQPIVLTTGEAPLATVLVTPFDELGLGDLSSTVYELVEESPERVAFELTRNGVTIHKVFTFVPDTYSFEMRLLVENRSAAAVSPRFAVTWPAASQPGQDFSQQALAALHEGSVEREMLQSLGTPGFFGGGEREVRFSREIDWTGVDTTYFISAMLPDNPAQASARFVATQPGHAGVTQVFFDPVQLPPGQSAERIFRVYMGPKEPERLEAVGGALVQSIDVGWSWLAPLTRFFAWTLTVLYGFVPNYGFAIILLTVLVRVVTTPLTNKQMRSMERMRALSPKLTELKEKYADDRQKQSEEMMRLYRQEGVNPLGGCFPMLLQLPVFIGLFYALRSSIQLRQAPFIGWIDDLSAPDTLFVIPGLEFPFRLLPLIMGGTMFLQQKITPMQQMDPAQQKMMITVMPIMMTVISWTFPSGLVLYWMISNVLAVAHQLWIGRGMRPQPTK